LNALSKEDSAETFADQHYWWTIGGHHILASLKQIPMDGGDGQAKAGTFLLLQPGERK